MSDEAPTSDIEAKPISYTEELRRAKRNSLVWSSLMILVCIGEPLARDSVSPSSITLSIIALTFSRMELLLATTIPAIFFFFGYWRAASLVKRFSSQLVLSHAFTELTSTLRQLQADASDTLVDLMATKAMVGATKHRLDGAIDRVRGDVSLLMQSVRGSTPLLHERVHTVRRKLGLDVAGPATSPTPPPPTEEMREAWTQGIEGLREEFTTWSQQLKTEIIGQIDKIAQIDIEAGMNFDPAPIEAAILKLGRTGDDLEKSS